MKFDELKQLCDEYDTLMKSKAELENLFMTQSCQGELACTLPLVLKALELACEHIDIVQQVSSSEEDPDYWLELAQEKNDE